MSTTATAPEAPDKPAPTEKPEAADDTIDVTGFQAAWRDLQDTHAFFGLLRQFGVSRTQARISTTSSGWPR